MGNLFSSAIPVSTDPKHKPDPNKTYYVKVPGGAFHDLIGIDKADQRLAYLFKSFSKNIFYENFNECANEVQVHELILEIYISPDLESSLKRGDQGLRLDKKPKIKANQYALREISLPEEENEMSLEEDDEKSSLVSSVSTTTVNLSFSVPSAINSVNSPAIQFSKYDTIDACLFEMTRRALNMLNNMGF